MVMLHKSFVMCLSSAYAEFLAKKEVIFPLSGFSFTDLCGVGIDDVDRFPLFDGVIFASWTALEAGRPGNSFQGLYIFNSKRDLEAHCYG